MRSVYGFLSLLFCLSLACNVVGTSESELATSEPTAITPPTQDIQAPPAQPQNSATLPVQDEEFFVVITSPEAGSRVNRNGFTVTGQQRGSFENNVVVQALDANGNILKQVSTTAVGELGEVGTWEITLNPTNAPVDTRGTVYVFYESPRDGSIQAYWQIEVTYINE